MAKELEPKESILSSSAGMLEAMDGSNRLAAIQGTSMSCPEVAAIVALWKQYWKRKTGEPLTTAGIKAIIEKHGQPKNNETGWGCISFDWIMLEA